MLRIFFSVYCLILISTFFAAFPTFAMGKRPTFTDETQVTQFESMNPINPINKDACKAVILENPLQPGGCADIAPQLTKQGYDVSVARPNYVPGWNEYYLECLAEFELRAPSKNKPTMQKVQKSITFSLVGASSIIPFWTVTTKVIGRFATLDETLSYADRKLAEHVPPSPCFQEQENDAWLWSVISSK